MFAEPLIAGKVRLVLCRINPLAATRLPGQVEVGQIFRLFDRLDHNFEVHASQFDVHDPKQREDGIGTIARSGAVSRHEPRFADDAGILPPVGVTTDEGRLDIGIGTRLSWNLHTG